MTHKVTVADADPTDVTGCMMLKAQLHQSAGQPLHWGVMGTSRQLQWHMQTLLSLAGPRMLWVQHSQVSPLASALGSWA